MIFEDYMLKCEYIGRNAQVEYGPLSNMKKIDGKIIFETKNTISIRDESKSYVIAKKSIRRLGLFFHDEICFVNGSVLVGRPEDRLLK